MTFPTSLQTCDPRLGRAHQPVPFRRKPGHMLRNTLEAAQLVFVAIEATPRIKQALETTTKGARNA